MLDIYKNNSLDSIVNEENPMFAVHDATFGSWQTQQFFIKNSNSSKSYDSVSISINFKNASVNENEPSPSGMVYQLFPGSVEPTLAEWESLPWHNQISLGAIDNDVNYYPFWIRTYMPASSDIDNLDEVSIKIEAIETV